MLLTDNTLIDSLRCLGCGCEDLSLISTTIQCCQCGYSYHQQANVWDCVELTDPSQRGIQAFWGDLYRQLYQDNGRHLNTDRLYRLLDALEVLLKNSGQPIGWEIDLSKVKGRRILEVGCGNGSHSCLLKRAGAQIFATDITPNRVLATHEKLAMIKEGVATALRVNAEKMPFRNNNFDVVYSFGVLHHTTDTQAAVNEVWRVLKPGGNAVIMLYSRRSLYYYVLLFKGILTGDFFTNRNWLGKVTEGRPKFNNTHNPFTRCYSARELKKMFSKFRVVNIRKSAFSMNQIPVLGKIVEKWLLKAGWCQENEGGLLVWDKPLRLLLPWELRLGRLMGFAYNITCVK